MRREGERLIIEPCQPKSLLSLLAALAQGRVAEHIREIGEARVCTSVIVAAELRYGAVKKGSQRLTAKLDAVLEALDILPFETACRCGLRRHPCSA
jgi:predicted nucleic acid-binding protein